MSNTQMSNDGEQNALFKQCEKIVRILEIREYCKLENVNSQCVIY